jgi:hypothetical protein
MQQSMVPLSLLHAAGVSLALGHVHYAPPLSLMQLDGPMHMLFWTDTTTREGAWRSNMHGRSNTCVHSNRPGASMDQQEYEYIHRK